MQVQRYELDLVTSAGGAVTGFTPNVTGRVLGVIVKVPGSGGIANAAIVVTAESTGEPILTLAAVSASGVYYPRGLVQGPTGANLTTSEPVALANDRVSVAITGGGNALACTIYVIIG